MNSDCYKKVQPTHLLPPPITIQPLTLDGNQGLDGAPPLLPLPSLPQVAQLPGRPCQADVAQAAQAGESLQGSLPPQHRRLESLPKLVSADAGGERHVCGAHCESRDRAGAGLWSQEWGGGPRRAGWWEVSKMGKGCHLQDFGLVRVLMCALLMK